MKEVRMARITRIPAFKYKARVTWGESMVSHTHERWRERSPRYRRAFARERDL